MVLNAENCNSIAPSIDNLDFDKTKEVIPLFEFQIFKQMKWFNQNAK